ncbi:MAG TPA: patatin-like phospholipase family protein [Nitrospira sp.]|nr:patatin-like phospholipase family protein [Nitrospira sp.]
MRQQIARMIPAGHLWVWLLCATAGLEGCYPSDRLPAVPPELQAQAEVAGLPGVRYMAVNMADFIRDAEESARRELEQRAQAGEPGPLPPVHFLAVSGGGDNGAFGTGLLNGWTASGTRPEFKLVTGISTGALIAPFAFLGQKYDPVIKEIYTGISSKDILEERNFLAALLADAMADNAPLWNLTKKYVTEQLLQEIAVEHAKGRMLLVGTTNLDARQGVIWNMGKIAASGHPDALHLFRSILIASAALPAAFPPVFIDVEVKGQRYHEMHVDGGASSQVFVYPPQLHLGKRAAETGMQRDRHLYVIRNARLDPDWAQVERRTMSIAARAITSLIQTQGRGDLFRIFAIAQRDQVDFNLAYIPETFKAGHKEEFDNPYMRQLFQLGYDLAKNGYDWTKQPPGY